MGAGKPSPDAKSERGRCCPTSWKARSLLFSLQCLSLWPLRPLLSCANSAFTPKALCWLYLGNRLCIFLWLCLRAVYVREKSAYHLCLQPFLIISCIRPPPTICSFFIIILFFSSFPRNSPSWYLIFFLIFLCMGVCPQCVCLLYVYLVVWDSRRGHQTPWDWSHRRLWASLWVPEIDLRPSKGAASTHNLKSVFPTLCATGTADISLYCLLSIWKMLSVVLLWNSLLN